MKRKFTIEIIDLTPDDNPDYNGIVTRELSSIIYEYMDGDENLSLEKLEVEVIEE